MRVRFGMILKTGILVQFEMPLGILLPLWSLGQRDADL